MLFSIVAISFYFPTKEGVLSPTSFPTFIVCRFLDDGHSDWCEVILQRCFDLQFSNNEWSAWR